MRVWSVVVDSVIIMLTTHLLINNIKRQYAETVKLLLSSSRADRVEGTASYGGEDSTHRVRHI